MTTRLDAYQNRNGGVTRQNLPDTGADTHVADEADQLRMNSTSSVRHKIGAINLDI
jgi:hypothetical protein